MLLTNSLDGSTDAVARHVNIAQITYQVFALAVKLKASLWHQTYCILSCANDWEHQLHKDERAKNLMISPFKLFHLLRKPSLFVSGLYQLLRKLSVNGGYWKLVVRMFLVRNCTLLARNFALLFAQKPFVEHPLALVSENEAAGHQGLRPESQIFAWSAAPHLPVFFSLKQASRQVRQKLWWQKSIFGLLNSSTHIGQAVIWAICDAAAVAIVGYDHKSAWFRTTLQVQTHGCFVHREPDKKHFTSLVKKSFYTHILRIICSDVKVKYLITPWMCEVHILLQGGSKTWQYFIVISSPNVNAFLEFFHCLIQWTVGNNMVTEYPTTP